VFFSTEDKVLIKVLRQKRLWSE